MPTTVKKLFSHCDISEFNKVSWGTDFKEIKQGVYIVSTSNDPSRNLGVIENPLFDESQINIWLNKLPFFTVDNHPATLSSVKNRLKEFWFEDESILYIGKAPVLKSGSGISMRVKEYYSTVIGNGRPHSGGQWIKVLRDINLFTIYYSPCENPGHIEHKMLEYFISNVSKNSLLKQYDKKHPLPFANIKLKGNKLHGFSKQRL